MKLLFFSFLALLAFSCTSLNPEYTNEGYDAAIRYIIVDRSSSSPQADENRINTKLNQLIAGYLYGYSFEYEKNKTITFTVNALIKERKSEERNFYQTSISNKAVNVLQGVFRYTIPSFPENSKTSKLFSVKQSVPAGNLYESLLIKTIKNNAKPGDTGIIFPVGSMNYSISKKAITMKSFFIISIK